RGAEAERARGDRTGATLMRVDRHGRTSLSTRWESRAAWAPRCQAGDIACQSARRGGRASRPASGLPAASFLLPGEVMHDGEYTDGERRVLEQVAQLARALRADRERLTRRLAEVGAELNVLAWTLDGQPALVTLASRRACHLAPKISSNRRTARSQTNAVVTNRMPAAASPPPA